MNDQPRDRAVSGGGLWIALISLAVLVGLTLLAAFASLLPCLAPGLKTDVTLHSPADITKYEQ